MVSSDAAVPRSCFPHYLYCFHFSTKVPFRRLTHFKNLHLRFGQQLHTSTSVSDEGRTLSSLHLHLHFLHSVGSGPRRYSRTPHICAHPNSILNVDRALVFFHPFCCFGDHLLGGEFPIFFGHWRCEWCGSLAGHGFCVAFPDKSTFQGVSCFAQHKNAMLWTWCAQISWQTQWSVKFGLVAFGRSIPRERQWEGCAW